MEASATIFPSCQSALTHILAAGNALSPASTAERLLQVFGSVNGVLAASRPSQRRAILHDEAAVVAIAEFRSVVLHLLRRAVEDRCVIDNWQNLLDYLHVETAHSPIERARILFLNSRNILIHDDYVIEGSIDEVAVYTREVVRHALDVGAAGIIIVHNHPSGDPSPSKSDISITRAIDAATRSMGISLLDHVILSAGGHNSLRKLGLL